MGSPDWREDERRLSREMRDDFRANDVLRKDQCEAKLYYELQCRNRR